VKTEQMLLEQQQQQEMEERARKTRAEMQLNTLVMAINNLKIVYQSRLKVDTFDWLKDYSDHVLKQY
jgi:hypothetical protein